MKNKTENCVKIPNELIIIQYIIRNSCANI